MLAEIIVDSDRNPIVPLVLEPPSSVETRRHSAKYTGAFLLRSTRVSIAAETVLHSSRRLLILRFLDWMRQRGGGREWGVKLARTLHGGPFDFQSQFYYIFSVLGPLLYTPSIF